MKLEGDAFDSPTTTDQLLHIFNKEEGGLFIGCRDSFKECFGLSEPDACPEQVSQLFLTDIVNEQKLSQ